MWKGKVFRLLQRLWRLVETACKPADCACRHPRKPPQRPSTRREGTAPAVPPPPSRPRSNDDLAPGQLPVQTPPVSELNETQQRPMAAQLEAAGRACAIEA